MVGSDVLAFQQFLKGKGSNEEGKPALVTIYLNSNSGGFSGIQWQLIAYDALGVLVRQASDDAADPRFLSWSAIVGIL